MLGWAGEGGWQGRALTPSGEGPHFIKIAGESCSPGEDQGPVQGHVAHAQARGKKLAMELGGPSAFPAHQYISLHLLQPSPAHSTPFCLLWAMPFHPTPLYNTLSMLLHPMVY